MSCVVIGTGRSGTNIALEMLSGNSYFVTSRIVEDKGVFKNFLIPERYLTKCDTLYFDYFKDLVKTLINHDHLKIVFTIRDPRDILLSKLYRGRPTVLGGDCSEYSDDSTVEGALKVMQHMFKVYQQLLVSSFAPRVMLIKMEDLLLHPERSAHCLCKFLDISYEADMTKFYLRMRNAFKVRRYGLKIDLTQIGLWKRWNEVYKGYFSAINFNAPEEFKKVQYLVEFFDYV